MTIKVKVTKDGATIQREGVAGTSCADLLKEIANDMESEVLQTTNTDDYYKESDVHLDNSSY